MKLSQKSFIVGGLLLAGLGLPRATLAAAPGCTDGFLTGTYNAEISSLSFMNVLSSINTSAGGTGGNTGGTTTGGTTGGTTAGTTGGTTAGTTGKTTAGTTGGTTAGTTGGTTAGTTGGTTAGMTGGTTAGTSGTGVTTTVGIGTTGSTGSTGSGTTAGGQTGALSNPGGFGNNKFSLSGAVPGSGRFFFDGVGNIWGLDPATAGAVTVQNLVIGSYDVNSDCSATLTLNTGEHFNAVLANQGADVLFMQSDPGSGGATGHLTRALNSCPTGEAFPSNFAFSLFGAQRVSATTGGGTTGTTGTTTGGTTGTTGGTTTGTTGGTTGTTGGTTTGTTGGTTTGTTTGTTGTTTGTTGTTTGTTGTTTGTTGTTTGSTTGTTTGSTTGTTGGTTGTTGGTTTGTTGGTTTGTTGGTTGTTGGTTGTTGGTTGTTGGTTGTTGGTTGTTTGTTGTATANLVPYSAVGEVELNVDNTFTMKEWIYSNNKVQAVRVGGTYSVGSDCRLQLKFANNTATGISPTGGTTGAVAFQAPSMFTVTLSRGEGIVGPRSLGTSANLGATGSLIVTPANVSTVVGTFLPQ